MRILHAAIGAASLGLVGGGTALAQMPWTPGSEIVGHSVAVTTNGITNTIYLDAGGAARIMTPSGASVPATWSAGANQLCLRASGAQECWPYNQPFQAGQQVTLTSNCNATSSWLADSINPSQPEVTPERG